MITDSGLVSIGLAKQTQKILTKSKLKIDIFDGVNPNPMEENVTKGVKKYQSGKYDGIIAWGGGSAMDVARTIRFMAVHKSPLSRYDDAVGGEEKIVNPLHIPAK